ncbi:protein bric-a-brac 1-like [Pollicipes pollicipes]|uniref:protein bric-a-brac 1-like n=1 Tax=Pollicipes pollicipes TaxID=41117 RepID=UPI0018850D63|nr:protein bric-a-brac 1-like [Pollicipes pollicipes]
MADQQFCLRWNNFQNNIISSFEYLRSEEDFVDVTLACEGRSLKAHKVILSACSQYFRDLLKTTPCSHPIIVLKDVSFDDLLSLMCFVYQGVVYIGQERLTQFLKTAEFLQIKGLSEHCIGEPFARQQPATQSSPSQSEEALSLVTETSILRQRIEGRSADLEPVKVETNGPGSPAGEHAKLSPGPLLMDPNAISMVGRESIGFPFLSQPGTSSLLATATALPPAGPDDQQMSYAAGAEERRSRQWSSRQPRVCPICNGLFSNKFNLKQHIVNVHTSSAGVECSLCKKVCKNKWYRRRHEVVVHGAPLKRGRLGTDVF